MQDRVEVKALERFICEKIEEMDRQVLLNWKKAINFFIEM